MTMNKQDIPSGFVNVDKTENPEYYVKFLDIIRKPFQVVKDKSFTLLDIRKGAHILDVACGTGGDVRELAKLVGSTGLAVGVDHSEIMIGEAKKRTSEDLPVEFHLGNACQLNFADNSFDGCRAERLFPYLEEPRQVLAEMIRITKVGGSIVIAEPDLETVVMDLPDRKLTRKLLNFWCDSFRNGWVARQLFGLFKEFALLDIIVASETTQLNYAQANQTFEFQRTVERAQESGVISNSEGGIWLDYVKTVSQNERFFCSMTFFILSGKKSQL